MKGAKIIDFLTDEITKFAYTNNKMPTVVSIPAQDFEDLLDYSVEMHPLKGGDLTDINPFTGEVHRKTYEEWKAEKRNRGGFNVFTLHTVHGPVTVKAHLDKDLFKVVETEY